MLKLTTQNKRAGKMERRAGVEKQNITVSYNKPQVVSLLGATIFVLFMLFAIALFALPAWHGWRSYTHSKLRTSILSRSLIWKVLIYIVTKR